MLRPASGCLAAEEIQLGVSDSLCFQFRFVGGLGEVGEAEVDPLVQHLIDDFRPVEELELDKKPGMLRGKHADCALPRNFGGIRPRSDVELADFQAFGQINLSNEIGESFDHRFAVAQHQLSEDRRHHALPIKRGTPRRTSRCLRLRVNAGWDTPSAAARRPKCR
jgi:hypothetical protein